MVLLHGFLESSKIWKPFIPALTQKYKMICIDLPGHGNTGTFGVVHSMEFMAQVVKVVLDELEVEKASFVGHSMGGYVCLAFAEKYLERVQKIILMNSTPEADTEERKVYRDRAVKLVKKNRSKYVSMAISNLITSENNRIFKTEIDELKKDAQLLSEEGIVAALEGMKIRTDKIKLLKTFNSEKFLVIGKRDPVMDSERTKKVALECDCKVILTESGHLSYIENFTTVRDFLLFID